MRTSLLIGTLIAAGVIGLLLVRRAAQQEPAQAAAGPVQSSRSHRPTPITSEGRRLATALLQSLNAEGASAPDEATTALAGRQAKAREAIATAMADTRRKVAAEQDASARAQLEDYIRALEQMAQSLD